jgi:hypothetical protein
MKKQILFIQGARQGAYDKDKKLLESLQDELRSNYQIYYPKMPNEASPHTERGSILLLKNSPSYKAK